MCVCAIGSYAFAERNYELRANSSLTACYEQVRPLFVLFRTSKGNHMQHMVS